jgi:hypothetical protein
MVHEKSINRKQFSFFQDATLKRAFVRSIEIIVARQASLSFAMRTNGPNDTGFSMIIRKETASDIDAIKTVMTISGCGGSPL